MMPVDMREIRQLCEQELALRKPGEAALSRDEAHDAATQISHSVAEYLRPVTAEEGAMIFRCAREATMPRMRWRATLMTMCRCSRQLEIQAQLPRQWSVPVYGRYSSEFDGTAPLTADAESGSVRTFSLRSMNYETKEATFEEIP